MKISEIKGLLDGNIETWELLINNKDLLRNYKNSSFKAGGSVQINVIEDEELFIGKHELRILCSLFIKDELTQHELAFIADILGLSHKVSFESEEVEELISHMTDPEVNGEFNKEDANEILIN